MSSRAGSSPERIYSQSARKPVKSSPSFYGRNEGAHRIDFRDLFCQQNYESEPPMFTNVKRSNYRNFQDYILNLSFEDDDEKNGFSHSCVL